MSNKHKWYDVIVAWASGEKIQYFELGSDGWVNYTPFGKNAIPAFNSEELKWRIKPKPQIKRYRMALFKDGTVKAVEPTTFILESQFDRWISDIAEVEVDCN